MSLKALGDFDGAMRRFDEVVLRYPLSPYAERVRQTPFYQERRPAAAAPPAAPVPSAAPAAGNSQP